MNKFISTKRSNPCPACGDTKGKCRTFSDSSLILCMESAGGRQVTGFINTGDTKDGLWGKLIPEQDAVERGKSWQEQQEELAKKLERERAIERERLKHALPVDERSPEFRKLLLQLKLDDDHYKNLIDRGLTDKEIKSNLYRTVIPGQKISGIKSNLPGVGNNEITVSQRGYLCPVFDEYRRIIGCQLRLDNSDDEGGKYRWLRSEFPSHLLVEGHKELPITVLKGSGEDVYLAEGVLKPAVANAVHGKTFIGASGGNFTSSPKQLERILKNTVGKDGIVYFCPDAGFNLNPQVQRRDRATIEFVQSLGYKIQILDWGQLKDKHSVGDVDEIAPEVLESAIAIPASEFLKTPEQKARDERIEAERVRLEQLYGKEITREEYEEQKAENWWEWLKEKVKHTFNGFDQKAKKERVERVQQKIQVIKYGVDPLPTPSCGVKLPGIEFREGDRLTLVQELIALGWGYLLDRSHTGTGKSHEYNLLTKDKDEEGKTQGKIWYLHGDHRNPTVEPAEKKADLPSRHNGLIKDNSRHTPSGEPFLRRWKPYEENPEPDIPSNCPETDRFNNLSTKGYNIHGRQIEEGEKKQNPICAQCPILHDCIESGYKGQRKTVMEQSEVRAHPDSLPSPEEYSYGDDTLAWEEFSVLFNPTEERSLFKKDLDQQWEWLEREAPEVYDRLRPIKHKLTDLLSRKANLPRFGANTLPDAEAEANLRQLLGVVDYPELEADLLILKEINDRAASMTDVELSEANHVYAGNFKNDKERNEWKEAQKTANAHFKQEARNKNRDAHAALPTLGLYELILILFDGSEAVTKHREINDIFGCAFVNHGELTLTLNNSRHRSIALEAQHNIFLDATMRPEDLVAKLGIAETELITIYQERPSFDNLTAYSVHIEGMSSRDHSDACNERKKALVEEIKTNVRTEAGESYAVVGFKDDSLDTNGYWFADSRSTNKFKGVTDLIATGTPYQNYGAVKAEFYTVRRTLDGFDEYYNHLKEAEITQLVGRPRPHLYPNQQFRIYLISTNLDLTFLEEMGIKVETSHGLEWTPEAGTQSQSLKLSLVNKAIELGDQFWKMTQTEVAKQLGVTQARVSQILKEFGGKKRLQKILMSLYAGYIEGFIKSKAIYYMKEFQEWLNLNPDDLAKMGLNYEDVESYATQTFESILMALERYFKNGGSPEQFEEENDLPLFLAAAIVLGASPPT